ncbi:MAG: hypothetical protein Q8M76_14505 [Spirochaetaceae bacterium]|nr:hypothetical protein [Spirochaetaceae bacterium]
MSDSTTIDVGLNRKRCAPKRTVGERIGSIELPSLLLLSEAGMNFCLARGIILRDLRTRGGERAEGLAWSSFKADALARLVRHGFLAALEISRPEMVSARSHILKAVSSIVSGVLDRRMRAELGPGLGRTPGSAIERYARRMGIAEHLAILSMEFVQAAEKRYLLHLASKDPRARKEMDRIDGMLAHAAFRERLISHAAQRGELLVFRVEIEEAAVRVSIRNRGLLDLGAERGFEVRGAESVYHQRLSRECAVAGMGFGSSVSCDRTRGETLALIELRF